MFRRGIGFPFKTESFVPDGTETKCNCLFPTDESVGYDLFPLRGNKSREVQFLISQRKSRKDCCFQPVIYGILADYFFATDFH